MKIKSVTGKSIGDNAPLVLGAVGGAMVGRGLTAIITKPAGAAPTQAELNKKLLVQGAMAVAGVLGYAAIDGNDTAAQATKGAALGIAIDNTINVVSGLVSKSTAVTSKLAADTTINRFAKASLGLACPDMAGRGYHAAPVYLNRPRRSLRNPMTENAMSFDQLIANPKDLASA